MSYVRNPDDSTGLDWAVHKHCEGFGIEDLAEALRAVFKEVEVRL